MSFSLANPTGWTTGDQLTEDQINQIDLEHSRAIDGTNGGTYSLTSSLIIGGNIVHIDNLEVDDLNINNNVTVSGTVQANVFLGPVGTIDTVNSTTINATTVNATDVVISDDLTVTSDVSVGGNQSVSGQLSGGIVTSENGRFPSFFELSSGLGWDSNHNILIGTDPVLIYVSDSEISGPHTYTIQSSGARDGQFFIFKNDSSHDITWNSPTASPMTVVPAGDGLITWRSASVWRAMLVSPT